MKTYSSIFEVGTTEKLKNRIALIGPNDHAQWGKMLPAQVLAHLNAMFEMVYEDKHARPNSLLRFILRNLVKEGVTGTKPYSKNGKTAPQLIIKGERNFDMEKARLIAYIDKTQEKGRSEFEGREHPSFGKLSIAEWSTLFHKHIDHHLNQLGK